MKLELKAQPRNSQELAVDIAYMKTGIRDEEYDRPVCPRLLVVLDWKADMILRMDTVSYTHLDVYKRQILGGNVVLIQKLGRDEGGETACREFAEYGLSLDYVRMVEGEKTGDVYKRQV